MACGFSSDTKTAQGRLWLSSAGELESHGSVVQESLRAMAQ